MDTSDQTAYVFPSPKCRKDCLWSLLGAGFHDHCIYTENKPTAPSFLDYLSADCSMSRFKVKFASEKSKFRQLTYRMIYYNIMLFSKSLATFLLNIE